MEEKKTNQTATEVEAEEVREEKPRAEEVKAEVVNDKKSSNVDFNGDLERKIIFSLCYVWGVTFFLPLILYKGEVKATRHANEGLLLLLFSVAGNIILGGLSALSFIFGILSGLYSLAILVLGIIGIVYVITDQDKELPIIGKIKILK